MCSSICSSRYSSASGTAINVQRIPWHIVDTNTHDHTRLLNYVNQLYWPRAPTVFFRFRWGGGGGGGTDWGGGFLLTVLARSGGASLSRFGCFCLDHTSMIVMSGRQRATHTLTKHTRHSARGMGQWNAAATLWEIYGLLVVCGIASAGTHKKNSVVCYPNYRIEWRLV